MVEVNGLEPMTSCVQGRRSPNWATPPIPFLVGLDGVEPSTSRLSGVRSNQAELQALWPPLSFFGLSLSIPQN